MGVEPIRCCHHGILSPARLPIPSRRHRHRCISAFLICNETIITQKEMEYKYFFTIIYYYFVFSVCFTSTFHDHVSQFL